MIKSEAALWLEHYFEKLRFSRENHLELGDIRLTIGQQNQIVDIMDILVKAENNVNRD